MKVAGIVTEFNPFHNGHKYLIDTVRALGYTHIVCVMSGNFVQRGELALCDKFQRAKVAINNGADLIVELPVSFSLSGAELFAKKAIEILTHLGVDAICFGAECDDVNLLKKCSNAVCELSSSIRVKDLTNSGLSYPLALQTAVKEIYGDEISNILTDANNILAVEYIKNINDNIKIVPIKRIGVSHDSDATFEKFASASKIREMLKNHKDASSFIPEGYSNFSDFKKIENSVFLKIRSMNKNELLTTPDMTDDLADRFINSARNSTSYDEFLSTVKTKRYTLARIKRVILCAYLGIKKDDLSYSLPYIRILGMNTNGKEVLSNLNDSCPPVNTSLSALSKISDSALRCAEIEAYSTDIFAFATEKSLPAGSDFRSFPIIL